MSAGSAGTDTVTPLWWGVVALRVVTLIFAVTSFGMHLDDYAEPRRAWMLLGGVALWTVLIGLAYCIERTRRMVVIVVDLAVTLGLLGASSLVHPGEPGVIAPLLSMVWASGPVVAAAVHAGRIAGASFGAAVSLTTWLTRGEFSIALFRDAVLLIGIGFVVGLAATAARRSTERLRRAARAEAAAAERERLARSIHDGVLQVLARVQLRGPTLGEEGAELAELAAQQQAALRALVSVQPPDTAGNQEVDLRTSLQLLATPRVHVSVPADPVPLASADVDELLAVINEALTNTTQHAGTEARSWVLLEDLGHEVVVSVRDNGSGIPDGRLAMAETEGRLGVASAIRGRIADLGATLTLDTADGTEWEVRLARTQRPSIHRQPPQ